MAALPQPELRVHLHSTEFDVTRVQVRKIHAREAISQPFPFDVDLVVTGIDGLDGDKVLGAAVSLVFERSGVEVRTVYGMITSLVDLLDTEPNHTTYRVRVVSRLHRLSFIETHEVFLNISVP